MNPRTKRINYTTRSLILLGAILLAANILLGVVLMRQSLATIHSMVRNSMLSVSTTAAALVDGDALGSLTEKDVGSPAYEQIYQQLSAFLDNVNIQYIYAVRKVGEDSFIFTVDPDPVNPGEFGEEVLVTDALRKASIGIASVDDAPAEDEWGNFYSSYSPVYDSSGKIVGVIGVDFDEAWYSSQMKENSWSIIVVAIISIAVACLIVLYVTNRVRKQYRMLNEAVSVFSADIEELEQEISSDFMMPESLSELKQQEEPVPAKKGADAEIEELRIKMNSMHNEIRQYLKYVEQKAFVDGLTHVKNTTAYIEMIQILEREIEDGTANFQLAVFDINDLKPVNDQYGHAAGDRIIQAAAEIIAEIFGKENTFRIGGDEFLAITRNLSREDMEDLFLQLDDSIRLYNIANAADHAPLSIAKGEAEYDPETDKVYKDVFNRADGKMYIDKGEYHREKEPS